MIRMRMRIKKMINMTKSQIALQKVIKMSHSNLTFIQGMSGTGKTASICDTFDNIVYVELLHTIASAVSMALPSNHGRSWLDKLLNLEEKRVVVVDNAEILNSSSIIELMSALSRQHKLRVVVIATTSQKLKLNPLTAPIFGRTLFFNHSVPFEEMCSWFDFRGVKPQEMEELLKRYVPHNYNNGHLLRNISLKLSEVKQNIEPKRAIEKIVSVETL